MKKISKTNLKKKIEQILDIAPFLHMNPESVYLALLKEYPLSAIKECIKELKEESKLDENYEWVE